MATLTAQELQKMQEALSQKYFAAKAQYNPAGMKAANDEMNAYRAANGLEPQYATKDIAGVQAIVDAVTAEQTPKAAGGHPVLQEAAPEYPATWVSAPKDYSHYIRELYAAKEEAELAALEQAYQRNVATLDAVQGSIAPLYRNARNQAAAQSEQAKRNFAEYAAAQGLNSGAAGQAELSRSVTLQDNLHAVNQAEAEAFVQLDHQRAKLAQEYQAAIASARASGSYQLAAALYQEAVRADEALVSAALSQAGLNQNKWATDYTLWKDNQDWAKNLAALWLEKGIMPTDAMLRAMGIDKQQARDYINSPK